jgi:protein phosphatase
MVRLRNRFRASAETAPFTYAMHTHTGRVRHSNQDTCAASASVGAFAVCDGMGGAAGGEVASRLAADTFLGYLTPYRGSSRPVRALESPDVRLFAAVDAANQAVQQRARRSPELRGMGTTLVALLLEWKTERKTEPVTPSDLSLTLAHVGDSRCYRFRNSTLLLLTQDHSLVEEQLRNGEITAAQAEISPLRNIITRAVGSQPQVDAEIQHLSPLSGDLYLLASDGLTRELSDAAIEDLLRRATQSAAHLELTTLCHTLVDEANQHGGHDNITVLLVRIA